MSQIADRLAAIDRARAGKLHLPQPSEPRRFSISWCGKRRGDEYLSDDPSEVTCGTCLNFLDRDVSTTEIPTYLRSRAYGRATAILRERHRDEFDVILAETLPVVVEEEANS